VGQFSPAEKPGHNTESGHVSPAAARLDAGCRQTRVVNFTIPR